MKMFFGGSAAFTVATLLAASPLFYAKPLFAETSASQQPTSIQQQREETPGEIAPAQTKEGEALSASEVAASAQPTVVAPSKTSSVGEEPAASVLPEKIVEAPAAAAAITAPQAYIATAYNLPGRTASGLRVAKGIIAADPRVLPLGTRVRLEAGPYSGEYIVADTGSAVRGRKIDVWVPSYREACRFGRRQIKLSVLSYGGRRAKIRRQK